MLNFATNGKLLVKSTAVTKKVLVVANFLQAAKFTAAGLALIAMGGAGVGIGVIFGCFLLAVAIAPDKEDALFGYALLGFALTEAVVLFSLMMSFCFIFAF